MPANTHLTTRILINDFRPGIHTDYHASAAQTPAETVEGATLVAPGAATLEDTYGCCADASGALIPLPSLTTGKSSERLPTASNADAKYLTGMAKSYLMDGALLTDMFMEGTYTSSDSDRAAVFTMYGQWYETTNFNWVVIATMHRPFQGSSEAQDILYSKGATALLASEQTKAHLGGGNFTPVRNRRDINSNTTYQGIAFVAYGSPAFGATPPDWASGAIPAGEQALTTFDDANGATYPDAGSAYRIVGVYPDYSDTLVDEPNTLFAANTGFTAVHYLATHQGRLIGASLDHQPFGQTLAAADMGNVIEHIHYTQPFDFQSSLGLGSYEFGTFGSTKPYLSGVLYSVTADELLIIRDHDGGILVRGDLANPTIKQLPFINSTHGARCIPANTPFGLFYGTRNGVYNWSGGESTKHVSPQLSGWFWNPDTESRVNLGMHGRFAWWEPFVCAPNNFLFDTRHGSWWRLDNVTSTKVGYKAYDVAPSSNRLYAFPWYLEKSQNTVMWRTATPETLRSDYSWKSQPLAGSRDRVLKPREVELLVTNSSGVEATVTVTLNGFDEDGTAATPVAVTFTVGTNTTPQLLRKAVDAFEGTYIQVKIATTQASGAAPKIHSLAIDARDGGSIVRQ
jgi:hypothetical protein